MSSPDLLGHQYHREYRCSWQLLGQGVDHHATAEEKKYAPLSPWHDLWIPLEWSSDKLHSTSAAAALQSHIHIQLFKLLESGAIVVE